MRSIIKFCSVVQVVLLSSILSFSPLAKADLIPADLSISGTSTFDVTSDPASGSAIQLGGLLGIFSEVSTDSTVNDLSVTGSNPVAGNLTHLNDGVGASAIVDGNGLSAVPGFFFDFALSLINNSLTETFDISFAFAFDNVVGASGGDAYIDSEINLYDADNNELYFSDITSDTFFGDQKNGQDLNTEGAEVTDSGNYLFNILLAPGASTNLAAVLKVDGGSFLQDGLFYSSASASLQVVNVTSNSQPPVPVPEPNSLMLFVIFVALLVVNRLTVNSQ